MLLHNNSGWLNVSVLKAAGSRGYDERKITNLLKEHGLGNLYSLFECEKVEGNLRIQFVDSLQSESRTTVGEVPLRHGRSINLDAVHAKLDEFHRGKSNLGNAIILLDDNGKLLDVGFVRTDGDGKFTPESRWRVPRKK